MKYISNAFSPKMLNPYTNPTFTIGPTTFEEIQSVKNELISSIGHQNTADHVNMEKNRMNIQLEINDILYLVISQKNECNEIEYNYKKIIMK
ncbi:MAG: DUF1874 domain-containing protein [Methanosphaera stadtmanae]|nr:DUF1874 domain-containing protein [Methanosphaera stadtmanae]